MDAVMESIVGDGVWDTDLLKYSLKPMIGVFRFNAQQICSPVEQRIQQAQLQNQSPNLCGL